MNSVSAFTQLMLFLGLFCALPLLAQDWNPGYSSDKAGYPKPELIQARLTALDIDVDIEPQLKDVLISKYREASPELTAERTLQQARESRLVSEVRMLELEQLSQGVREELLRGEQVLLARRIDNASAGLERIQVKLRHGLTREAMRLSWLRQIPLPAVNGSGGVAERGLIEEVRGFADEFERVVHNLEQADRTRDQMAMHRKALDADFSAIKEELALAAGGIGMTQVLLDLHRRLPEKHRDVRMLITALPSVDDARLANQLLLAYLPSLLLVYGGLYEGGSAYLFNTGCAVFMLCHLLIAVIFWHMVSAETGWLAALMADQPDRLVLRWRYLWIPLVVGTPVAVAILASMGTIVAAAIVGYGLAVRWFRIRQRRLALARRLARDK